jgi:hypothetical protein
MNTIFGLENLKGRDHLEDQGIDSRILEWILGKLGRILWTGLIWLKIRTSGGLL